MQQGADGDDLGVVYDRLELPDACRKQPGSDDVVEQIGLAFLPGILHRPLDQRRIGNRNACKYSIGNPVHAMRHDPAGQPPILGDRFTGPRRAGSTIGGTSPRSRCARSARRRLE